MPLLAATVTISAFVLATMENTIQDGIDGSKIVLVDAEWRGLEVKAGLRANFTAADMARSGRALHLLTRLTSWLIFGGVDKSEAFTALTAGVDECKTFTNMEDCSYFQQNELCDCNWNDLYFQPCENFPFDSRYTQVTFVAGQSQDIFPNGDRAFSSFPSLAYSANTTAWWDDVTTVSGSGTGLPALGHETTYDRIRALSAVPVFQLIYNQDVNKEYIISDYVGFEADGMMSGYKGCSNANSVYYAEWVSSEANGGARLRPSLCPVGKYGYDAR
jgi:hypothetical protein